MNPVDVPQGRLYNDLAFLMPLVSPAQEYAEEAAHWRTVLRETLGPGRHPILELGVGGGCNLSHLTAGFDATAVDLSMPMLELCRRLNPGVPLVQGDMRTIRLRKKFAAVVIHDAISYMLNESDLLATFETAAAHLGSGGILITSPDRFLDTFEAPAIEHATHSADGTDLTYFEYIHDPNPDDTMVETLMTFFIRTREGLRIEHDRHVTGVFPKKTWFRLLETTGFSPETRSFSLETLKNPYELLVGKRT